MSGVDPRIQAALGAGGTVVVPNRQRAAALSLWHARGCLARGLASWPAPDILPLGAWLARVVDADRACLLPGLRRLGAEEEWLLWRECARAAAEGGEWLQAASLGEALRESLRLRRDWGVQWNPLADPEESFQSRALAAFEAATARAGAVSADDWPRLLAHARPQPRPLLFAGFDEPGSALRARVESLGGEWLAPAAAAASPDAVHVLADRAAEFAAAAAWARAWLLREPGARLLVIVPQLAQCRALAAREFARTLLGAGLLAPREDELPFAIEGGLPLPAWPVAQAALALCQLMAGECGFPVLSATLRSPWLSLGSVAEATGLELRLRDRNVTRATLASLSAHAARRAPGVHARLRALQALVQAAPTRAAPAAWAPVLASWLEAAGWPGRAPLSSDEHQVRVRLDELLGEFAQSGAGGGELAAREAVERLAALAARVAFEPASNDAPVTVTASTADPLVHYDGVWVAGLNAEAWPRPAQVDPFLPAARQRSAGIGRATAAGQLALAREAHGAWRARAGELVLSCAHAEDDAELQPSSLLGLAPGAGGGAGAGTPPAQAPLPEAWARLRATARLEPVPDGPLPPWPADVPLPGGTRALVLQAECPFKASAALRLGAGPLGEPQAGLPASERGRLLHAVLERTWAALRGQAGLLACTGAAREALVRRCLDAAIERLQPQWQGLVPPALVAIEAERQQRLVLALLDAEQRRAPFEVVACEREVEARLGGVRLDVRIDRVDRLADGAELVLDYKSGAPASFNPLEERPTQAQLLAYALLLEGEPAALATVHLRGGEVSWCGAAREAGVLPATRLARGYKDIDWPAWLAHWRRVVPALANDFAAGVARVDPRPRACEHCHLDALCRIDAGALAGDDEAGDQAGEEGGKGGEGGGRDAPGAAHG